MMRRATKLLARWIEQQHGAPTPEERVRLRIETSDFLFSARREPPPWSDMGKVIEGAAKLFRKWLDVHVRPLSPRDARELALLRTDTTGWFLRRIVDTESATAVVDDLSPDDRLLQEVADEMKRTPRESFPSRVVWPAGAAPSLSLVPSFPAPDAEPVNSANRHDVRVEGEAVAFCFARLNGGQVQLYNVTIDHDEAINLAAWIVALLPGQRSRFERMLRSIAAGPVARPALGAVDADAIH